MSKHKLKTIDLAVGEKLDWAAYDESGMLLLKKGSVIQSQRQIDTLLDRGLYRLSNASTTPKPEVEKPIADDTSPFQLLDDIFEKVKNLYMQIDEKNLVFMGEAQLFEDRILKTTHCLRKICDKDPDAMLGAVHLIQNLPYIIYHPIQVAILSDVIANRLELKQSVRNSIIAAALTQNISMLKLQHMLSNQKECLSEEQRNQVNAHPGRSIKLLKNCSIEDPVWLDSVLHHHETIDGTGYPYKLSEDRLSIEAQIIGLADRYSAKISNRSYRAPVPAKEALREFFVEKHKQYNEELILAFIKELGIFPPGSYLTLNNGETTVVIRRQKDTPWPIVCSVLSPRGGPYARPLKRSTDSDQFGIKSVCTPTKKNKIKFTYAVGLHVKKFQLLPTSRVSLHQHKKSLLARFSHSTS